VPVTGEAFESDRREDLRRRLRRIPNPATIIIPTLIGSGAFAESMPFGARTLPDVTL